MEPRTKRQKVTIACVPCRSRKIKCNGLGPVCAPCEKKASNGVECSWQPGITRTPTHSWIQVRQNSSVDNSSARRPKPSSTSEETWASTGSQPALSSIAGAHSLPTIYPKVLRSRSPQASSQSRHTFAVSRHEHASFHLSEEAVQPKRPGPAIMEVPVDDSGQEGFFGSSSVENFMQNVQKMVQQKIQGEDQPKGLPDAQPINTRALLAADHKKPGIKPMEYVLPPRRRADVLLSVYWKYVHVLYPYLDKPSVQAEYEQLWKGDGSICEERSFVGLLNVIFALSCLLDDSLAAEDREDAARTFYLRARELIDLVENGSIRSVQSFLLLGQYFQSTNASHPCWVFVGTAIRTAQSLGLHLAETSESAPNASARELLRRVWYGCVLMDRVVATTYGRPCMIGPRSATMVPLPMSIIQSPPISGELVEQSDSIDDFIAVEFYILTLKLYEILHDVVFNFYAFNFQIQPLDIDKFCGSLNEGHQSVFEIERRLFRWEQDVPEYLKVPQSQQEEAADTVVRRQAVVLKQRQLHVRLLLLRPVLSYFVTSEFHDGHLPIPLESLLSQRLLLQCAIVCVKVALEAIYIVCAEGSSTVGQMGNVSAWWDCVLYIYTSATILIAARLSPAVLSEISEDLILEGWRKAMAVLERYSCLNPTITRLIATQRLLFEAVPQHYSRHKKNAQQARRNVAGPNCSDSEVLTVPHEEPVGVAANKANSDEARLIGGGQVEESALPSSPFLGWETGFDPDDLSWLMTIPLDC